MVLNKGMFSVLVLAASFAMVGAMSGVGVGMAEASILTRTADLCLATGVDHQPEDPAVGSGGCEYSSQDVPKIDADVCWNAGVAVLKGEAPCEGRARSYHVTYGEVLDSLTGELVAYAPLPDTCTVVGCEPLPLDPGPLDDDVACCDPYTGDCWPTDANGECGVGEYTWCKNLEVVDDDTVICHD